MCVAVLLKMKSASCGLCVCVAALLEIEVSSMWCVAVLLKIEVSSMWHVCGSVVED